MTRHLCEYKNKSNHDQIVTIDTVLEKFVAPQKTVKFEATLNQLLQVRHLDGDIGNIISDSIPCYKLIINYYIAV